MKPSVATKMNAPVGGDSEIALSPTPTSCAATFDSDTENETGYANNDFHTSQTQGRNKRRTFFPVSLLSLKLLQKISGKLSRKSQSINRKSYHVTIFARNKRSSVSFRFADDESFLEASDVRLSIVSNLFFFTGSICFLILTQLDETSDTYFHLTITGCSFYTFNALYDLGWSWYDYMISDQPLASSYDPKSYIQKYVLSYSDYYYSVTFLVASLINLITATRKVTNLQANISAAFLYLLSSTFSSLGVQYTCPLSLANSFILAADSFFFLGAFIDAVLSVLAYMNDPNQVTKNDVLLGDFYIASSCLWLFNATLYLLGDLITWCTENKYF